MKQNKNFFKKPWVLIALIILVAAVIFGVLQLTHMTHFFAKQGTPNTTYYPGPHTPTGGQNTKGEVNNVPSVVQSNPNPKGFQNTPSPGSSTSNAVLITPTGDFVNSHHVTQSSSMLSDCNTTEGATCQIIFTNASSGATVPLNSQTTDSNGAVYWYWTPKQVGLTPGTYKITATATLNGQSKSASDAMNIEVSQ